MAEAVLTERGWEAQDKFLNRSPPILKQESKGKIFRTLCLLMKERGCREAGREPILEAMSIDLTKPVKGNLE